MQTHCASHAQRRPRNRIRHIWSVDVVQVVTAHQRQSLQSLQVTTSEAINPQVVFCSVVIVNVRVVVRFVRNDTPHRKYHIKKSQPRRILPSPVQIICSERRLIQHRHKDLHSIEVGINQSLAI